jgi:hypothetical protein
MRRLLSTIAVTVVAAWVVSGANADLPVQVTGGGTGTFAADLDPAIDPDIDGSHFGLGAVFSGSTTRGHFECLMAGDADILGLPLMAVEGNVTGGSADAATGTATFTGTATVNLANSVAFRGMQYRVLLWAGGPGAGHLQLTVLGAFDGVPGDAVPGNGNYDLPVETVATGHITVH